MDDFTGSLAREDIRTLNTVTTPAIEEWMPSTVEIMFMANPRNAHYAIAQAHNASIAAERKDHTERMNSVQDFYSRQLKAEQEKWEQRSDKRDEQEAEYVGKMTKELTAQIADRKQLREQLAARQHDITECVATLAAERERVKELQDEIDRLKRCWKHIKLGEGK